MAGVGSETTSHQKWRSRIEYLREHLEISDASLRMTANMLRRHTDPKACISDALPIDCERYSYLNHPVSRRNRVIAHSRSKLSEFAVIATYTHFAEYLQGILSEMYEYNPLLVVGKAVGNHQISFPEIVKHGDFHKLSEFMVSQVFRSLENERSTGKLLDKILNNTGVTIPPAIRDDALYYLEMRHLFIHQSGFADKAFVTLYGSRSGLTKGAKLPTDFNNANAAITAASNLCREIDRELIKQGVVTPWRKPWRRGGS